MAIYKEDIVNIELSTGKIFRSFLENTIGSGDELANRFGVRVFRNGVPEDVGGTCIGLFIRADGGTVTISSGTVSGNVAYVTLPEACYAVEGNFTLAIKCQGGGVTGTLRIVDGVVSRTSTSAAVDPGNIIPSVEDLIEAIDTAIASIPADYSDLWETIAPNVDPESEDGYKAGQYVTYNGGLYRFKVDHTGSWNSAKVEAVSVGGELEKLDDTAHHISPKQLAFSVINKNLFDPYTLKKGIQISLGSGHADVENEHYDSSDFIPVESGTAYVIRYQSYLFFYDENKNYVSTDSNTYQNNYTFTPSQDGYVRFSNNIDSDTNRNNTEHNIVAKATDYYRTMPFEYDFDENFVGVSKYIRPLNLIESLENGYIRRSDGAVASPTGQYRSSNLVKIDPSKYYYTYNVRPDFGGFFDKFGAYISTSGNLSNPFRASDYVTGACYVRVSGFNDQVGLYERPFGKHVPIGEKYFNESLINMDAPVKLDVFLPPDFYVNTGRTIEIFNETLIPNPDAGELFFRWSTEVGVCYGRKLVVTSDTAGDYNVTLTIYDKWFNVLFTGTTTVHVVSAIATDKTIVPIGDSITNGKPWLRYIAEDIANSGIHFTGTRWHDTGTSISAAIKHEGRSGWRASSYVANTVYTFDSDGVSSANPFYDSTNSKFSWAYYKTTYSISPDGVQFFLGTNGLALAPSTEENAISNMVTDIRANDANIPIFVCYPIHVANQDGCARQANSDGYTAATGMFYAEKKLAMWNFIKRLYTRLSGVSGVYFVPVCQTFDHEYMFGITEVPVNQYSDITTGMPTEAVHPRDYHQFTDIMYGAYCYAWR